MMPNQSTHSVRSMSVSPAWSPRGFCPGWIHVLIVFTVILLLPGKLSAQDLNLSPSRPTVANSVTIQDKGVLQAEIVYDAFPQHNPGNQQTVGTSLYYVPVERLRLDFGWSAFSHQEGEDGKASGIGTIQLGGKIVLVPEQYNRAKPGIALQYEAELPTASRRLLQGFGQQIIVLLNHHYGPNGIVDVIVNGSLVQADCQTRSGCRYGGQQSFALSYHLDKHSRLYAEVFGQNVSQSDAHPGLMPSPAFTISSVILSG